MTLLEKNASDRKTMQALRTTLLEITRKTQTLKDCIVTENCGDPRLLEALQSYERSCEYLWSQYARFDQTLTDAFQELKN